VRRVEQAVRDVKAGRLAASAAAGEASSAADDDDESARERVAWSASPLDAAAWTAWGREMLRTVAGTEAPDWKLAEILAADTLARLGWPEESEPEPGGACAEESSRSRPRGRRRFDARSLEVFGRDFRPAPSAPDPPEMPDPESGTDAWEIHGVIERLIALRHGVEFEKTRLLLWMAGRRLYRFLRYASGERYVEHGLGLAPREAHAAIDLQGDLLMFPEIARAWHEGRLPPNRAKLLVQVASRDTEPAWVEHATTVSLDRLELEVNWNLALRSVMSTREYLELTGGTPHPEIASEVMRLDWEEFFGVHEAERRQAQGSGSEPGGACVEDGETSGLELEPVVRVAFSAPPRVAAAFRAAIRRTREASGANLDDGECVARMLIAFAHEHAGRRSVTDRKRWEVLERDGWRCALPNCRMRSHLQVHHVRFRSEGGSDERENLITLCVGCHRLIHEGHVLVSGAAPDALVVRVGRLPDGRWRETWHGFRRVN
jgi:hypothetical protein